MADDRIPDIALLPDGKSVLVEGERLVCGAAVARGLAVYRHCEPGVLMGLNGASRDGSIGRRVDVFFASHPAFGFVRLVSPNRGSALNCRVRAATRDEMAAAGLPVDALPVATARRPSALSPDQVRELAGRYARGEISREAMSAAFWRARA